MNMQDIPDLKEVAEEIGSTVRAKASNLSISLAVIFVFFALSVGGFIFATKDVWLEGWKLKLDTEHLHAEHTECRAQIARLEQRVKELELRLKITASN